MNHCGPTRASLVLIVLLCFWGCPAPGPATPTTTPVSSGGSPITKTPSPTPSDSPTSSPAVAPDNPVERRALYFPNDKVYGEVPEEVEVVTFKTQDNLELQAWYLPPAKGQYLLVYFHGNGGNLSGLGRLFKILKEGGFGVLAVDYRGYGKSEGDPSEQGLYLDGLAAYDYALGKVKPERLVLHGRSLGGGVASYVAQNRHCAALVLESTFTSTHEVAKGSHGAKAAMFIEAFDNLSRMKSLKMPVFIIHGDADNLIPPQMSKQLHEACPNSTLWLVEGATHNNLLRTAGNKVYTQKIKEFLEGAEGNNL